MKDFHKLDWPATLVDLGDTFEMVSPLQALAEVIPGTRGDKFLYLVLTCEGSYKSLQKLEDLDKESRDTVPALYENLCE